MLHYPRNLRAVDTVIYLSAHKSKYMSVFYSILLDTCLLNNIVIVLIQVQSKWVGEILSPVWSSSNHKGYWCLKGLMKLICCLVCYRLNCFQGQVGHALLWESDFLALSLNIRSVIMSKSSSYLWKAWNLACMACVCMFDIQDCYVFLVLPASQDT